MTLERERQRLDKWLWHARIVKTRTLAQKLIASGAVRVNGQRVTASDYRVKNGDGLTVTLGTRIKVLKVAAMAEKRGPASFAVTLYQDLSPTLEKPQS